MRFNIVRIGAATIGIEGLWGSIIYEDFSADHKILQTIDLGRIQTTMYGKVDKCLVVI